MPIMVTTKRTSKTKSNSALKKNVAPVVNVRACNLDTRDAIRAYAYSLYEQRGCEHGHDLADWLRAEGEALTHIGT
jgi:hypothetical protein